MLGLKRMALNDEAILHAYIYTKYQMQDVCVCVWIQGAILMEGMFTGNLFLFFLNLFVCFVVVYAKNVRQIHMHASFSLIISHLLSVRCQIQFHLLPLQSQTRNLHACALRFNFLTLILSSVKTNRCLSLIIYFAYWLAFLWTVLFFFKN